MTTPNVLASRYASPEVARIWSPEHKIVLERRLWIAVLKAQKDLGVDTPDGVIESYESVIDRVDLASIAAREKVTRHDVKARIEEFAALAGTEHIHKGMVGPVLGEHLDRDGGLELDVESPPDRGESTEPLDLVEAVASDLFHHAQYARQPVSVSSGAWMSTSN